ncbi:LLM class flavin-dependent oxidoreductase [Geodermatophilus sp. DF01-2]|uniref:LLM class flavin-dependent oxidoreductase n=1 Tax=Geodermatophilus sp. DF01-2 TaxID=2559610 RepID=UPI001073F052|nr:LLM class flavin-dependent oxidoreductase [Geodermatophilus sp. DF01_2]TFV64740.1 LLM class flavin-dependent oxidoreductase [Geodermatophilus sp. DF01_2]
MYFGVNLLGLAQQPRDQDMQERFAELLDWVHAVRDAGYDHFTMGQHYLTAPFQQFQPVPLLARLIPETGSMHMFSTLVAPLQKPVELAETWASLDVLSGGRVGMCLALGYRDEEYAAFGVDQKTRVRRQRELVETLIALWTQEEVTAEGLDFSLDRQTVTLRPVQRPHPPIWIAANADAAVQRAARWGLKWNINPHATHETVARQVQLYEDAWHEAGHEGKLTFPISREVFCAETREEAVRLAFPYLGQKYAAYGSWGQDKALPGDESFQIPLEELAGDRFIIGDPDDVAREIARYQEIGVDRMHLRTNWPGMPLETALTGMRLFAREVAPRFRTDPAA